MTGPGRTPARRQVIGRCQPGPAAPTARRHDLERPHGPVFTPGHWYLRPCQAVIRGGGGQLSAPVLSLAADQRQRALGAILELPDDIAILSWKVVAPVMATQLDGLGRGLNLLA